MVILWRLLLRTICVQSTYSSQLVPQLKPKKLTAWKYLLQYNVPSVAPKYALYIYRFLVFKIDATLNFWGKMELYIKCSHYSCFV